jgi:hypothetical protein
VIRQGRRARSAGVAARAVGTQLTPNYRIVVSRSGTLDEAEVEVEVSEAFLRAAGTDSLSGELE